jgi:hypothetical protein
MSGMTHRPAALSFDPSMPDQRNRNADRDPHTRQPKKNTTAQLYRLPGNT